MDCSCWNWGDESLRLLNFQQYQWDRKCYQFQCEWWWPYEGIVVVCERPVSIRWDEERRLHAEDRPAVEYADGYALASWHGQRVPIEWMAGKHPELVNSDAIPGCTYCDPEIASVGKTEAQAREAGLDISVGKFPFSVNGKALGAGHTDGFVKIITNKARGEIVGMHAIGHGVTDLVAEMSLAMTSEATAHDVLTAIHPHPTRTRGRCVSGQHTSRLGCCRRFPPCIDRAAQERKSHGD